MNEKDDLPVGTEFGRTHIKLVIESINSGCTHGTLVCVFDSMHSRCSQARCGGGRYRVRADRKHVIFVSRDEYLAARLAGEV